MKKSSGVRRIATAVTVAAMAAVVTMSGVGTAQASAKVNDGGYVTDAHGNALRSGDRIKIQDLSDRGGWVFTDKNSGSTVAYSYNMKSWDVRHGGPSTRADDYEVTLVGGHSGDPIKWGDSVKIDDVNHGYWGYLESWSGGSPLLYASANADSFGFVPVKGNKNQAQLTDYNGTGGDENYHSVGGATLGLQGGSPDTLSFVIDK
ncbi:hypothetical protein [Streptomyces blastmyceticus]